MTLAGLNTVNLSQLNTFQQIILFILIILGSAIWVSIAVVHVRRKAFERKFKSIVEMERQRRRDRSNSRGQRPFPRLLSRSRPEVDGVVVRGRAIEREKQEEVDGNLSISAEPEVAERDTKIVSDYEVEHSKPPVDCEASTIEPGASQLNQPLVNDIGVTRRITFASPSSPVRERQHGRFFSMQGIGARQNIQNHPMKSPRPIYPNELPRINEKSEYTSRPIFLSTDLVGRNSQFAGLTLAERERLGGVEYRAVSILAILVPAYFILWQLLGCVGLGAYVARKRVDATLVNAENPWYDQVSGFRAFDSSD